MTCFWWKLTYDIRIHIIRLSLKKGCCEINVEQIPTFAGCHLPTNPKSWSCGCRRIGLQVILLLVLETSQYPSVLCPEEGAVLRFDLPQIKNLIVIPGFPLEVFRFSKLLVAPSYFRRCFLSCTGSPLGPCSCCFSTGGHTTFQHVSGLTVDSSWDFNLCAAGIVGQFTKAQ